VSWDNAQSLLESGAIAVGLARQLFPHDWVKNEDWESIQTYIQQGLAVLQSLNKI
jgi:2-keto-3-deoxy-6-phosphogluconate aldolase